VAGEPERSIRAFVIGRFALTNVMGCLGPTMEVGVESDVVASTSRARGTAASAELIRVAIRESRAWPSTHTGSGTGGAR
jgi:hypothetical protein